jgi:hypothetical protein
VETTTETVYLTAGARARPVRLRREGKLLALSFRYSKGLVEEVKSLKGARWHPASGECKNCGLDCRFPKSWTVSDCSRNRVQLEILQGKLPRELERYEVPLLDVAPRRPLWRHQVEMFRFAATRRCCIWAAEPSTGKTLAAFEVMEWAADNFGFTEWTWVSPLNTQKATRLEMEKWGCRIEPTFINFDILASALQAQLRCGCGCTRDYSGQHLRKRDEAGVLRCLKCGHPGCGQKGPESQMRDETGKPYCRECRSADFVKRLPDRRAPHGVVIDELALVKNSGAYRTKACMVLADAVREEHDGFVLGMSGIPAPRDPCDWWSLAEITRPGYLREGAVVQLRKRLAVIETVQLETHAFPKLVSWKRDEVELLKRRLDGLVQVFLAKDCLDLPELRKEVVKLPPAPEAVRAARLVARTSKTAVEALGRARQLSDGFQYRDDGTAERAATPKDDALRDLLGRAEEVGRVIVYAGFHDSVDRCREVCRAEGWAVVQVDGRGWILEGLPEGWTEERALMEMDRGTWTDEVERLAFVAHPKSGGIGINLNASPVSIFYSLDFDYGTFGQALCRGRRPGMDVERGHVAYFLCHLATDEYVLGNLEKKREMQSWTLDEVEAVLA